MANSGMNTSFSKCFILFIAIVILLEGCLYLGLAIWGITQEKCSDQTTDIATNPFASATDLIYFISEQCGDPSVSTGVEGPYVIQVDWATSFVITNRMYIFMVTYAVVSGLWVVASLMVIASICGTITKFVVVLSFWPWFTLVIAGSILDVVATGFFGYDIAHTNSAYDTFQYVGVINEQSALDYFKTFDAYFVTPAVVLTCISSRVVLIWLLNIFGASFCLSLSRALAQNNHPHQSIPVIVPSTTNMLSREVAESSGMASESHQYDAQNSQVQVAEQYPVQIRPKPLPIQTPTTVVERQSYNQHPETPDRRSLSPLADYAEPIMPLVNEHPSNTHANELSRQTSAAAAITYRNTETHPDRLDYPAAQAATSAVDVRAATSPELSIVSPLNTRYSSADGSMHSAGQSQRVSDELRSQLPWSYTSMLTKPQPPRKPQVQIYPKIPEPDYADDAPAPNKITSANTTENAQQSYSKW